MTRQKGRSIHILQNFEARSVALFAAMALGGFGAIHAQAPARNGGPGRVGDSTFTRADTNQDGRLSREEARRLPAIFERFDQIDVDHDQFISRAEFDEALKS